MQNPVYLIVGAIVLLLMIQYWNFFLFVWGLQALKKQDHQKAVRLLKKAAASGMKPKHKLTCGYVLLTRGLEEDAESILRPLLAVRHKKFSHQDAVIYYSLLQWKRGELDEAVQALEELKETGYRTTILYTNLGFYLIEQGDLDKARELNLEALDYNGESKGILDNLGLTYIKEGEWEKAEALYEKLMVLDPAFPEAYYHNAMVESHRGNREKALDSLETGLNKSFTHLSTVGKEAFLTLKNELTP